MSAHHRPRKPAARHAVRHEMTEPKAPRQPMRLTVLHVGHFEAEAGIRLDCQRYEDCLSSHVATYPHDTTPARCPMGCRWWVAPGRMAAEHTYAADGGALARYVG